MGMAVCAEGVETREQAGQLAALGCDLAQGWLYAPALAPEDPRMQQVERGEPLAASVGPGEYAHAVTGGDDLVFVTDQQGRVEFVSAAAVTLLGMPSAAVIGTALAEHLELFPSTSPLREARVPGPGVVLPPDGSHRMVSRREGPDGRRWLEVDVSTTRDRDGRAWRVVGVGRDVTAVVAAEQRLAQSESRFRRAFDEAPIGMAMTTLDGRFLRVNAAFAAMLGRSPAEVLATTVAELTATTDRDVDEHNLRQVRAGEAQVHDVVKSYLHRDGSAVPTFVRAALVEGQAGQEPYILAHVLPRPERAAHPERPGR
jgi:PAS domain S-box-containing protein